MIGDLAVEQLDVFNFGIEVNEGSMLVEGFESIADVDLGVVDCCGEDDGSDLGVDEGGFKKLLEV